MKLLLKGWATVAALLKARANTALADRAGQTPLQLARERGYAEIVRMLEDSIAR